MALSVDDNGWLKTDAVGDPEIRIVPSHRNSHLRDFPCERDGPVVTWPIAHIDHTTDLTVSMEKLARRIVDDPTGTGASWHLGLARDGVIWQSVPFVLATRHVGNPGTIEGHQVLNVNRCTIGSEKESPGRLKRDAGNGSLSDERYYVWPYYKVNPATAKPDRSLGYDLANLLPKLDPYGQPFVVVPDGSGGWWAEFTPAQLVAHEAVVRAVSVWRPVGLPADAPPPLGRRSAWRYGHVDFPGSTGKEDPGRLWPAVRDKILDRVFGVV